MAQSKPVVPWEELGPGGQGEMTKEHKDTFGGDGYTPYLACGDGFMGVTMCQNS